MARVGGEKTRSDFLGPSTKPDGETFHGADLFAPRGPRLISQFRLRNVTVPLASEAHEKTEPILLPTRVLVRDFMRLANYHRLRTPLKRASQWNVHDLVIITNRLLSAPAHGS